MSHKISQCIQIMGCRINDKKQNRYIIKATGSEIDLNLLFPISIWVFFCNGVIWVFCISMSFFSFITPCQYSPNFCDDYNWFSSSFGLPVCWIILCVSFCPFSSIHPVLVPLVAVFVVLPVSLLLLDFDILMIFYFSILWTGNYPHLHRSTSQKRCTYDRHKPSYVEKNWQWLIYIWNTALQVHCFGRIHKKLKRNG